MATQHKYSDIDYRFQQLSSGDAAPIYDEKSINQSLMTLFSTLRGERWFNLNYGTDIPRLIFEPFDPLSAETLAEEIKQAIKTWESQRVDLKSVKVTLNYDSLSYIVNIQYSIKSTTTNNINFNFTLSKR